MKPFKKTVRIFGVEVDNVLATEAMKLGGHKSRTAAAREALDEYIKRHKRIARN